MSLEERKPAEIAVPPGTGSFAGLLHPTDRLAVGFIGLLTVIAVAFCGRVPYWWALVCVHAIAIAAILGLVRLHDLRRGPVTRFIRYWYPLPLVPAIFSELGLLVEYVHPVNFNTALMRIDLAIFGGHPCVMLERIAFPVLTDFLQLMYASYYFLPLVVPVILWRARRYREFRVATAVLAAAFFSSYIGYFAVPATAPRFIPEIQAEHATEDVEGVFITPVIRPVIDGLEPLQFDCFPSGHTEIALVSMLLAFFFTRRAFWVMLPIVVSLIFSTVYLRYHYAIDVFAGILLAVIVMLAVPPLCGWWERRNPGRWEGGLRPQSRSK